MTILTYQTNSLKVFLCWVNDDFEICKKFLSFYEIPDSTSKTILNFLIDILTRYQLTLDLCCGQCYDGASNMVGKNEGLPNNFLVSKQKHISLIAMDIPYFFL